MYITDRISPVPHSVEYQAGAPLLLATPGVANFTIKADLPADATLANNALAKLTEGLSSLVAACAASAEGAIAITMAIEEAPEGISNPDQGYKVVVSEDTVALIGFGEAGLYYAVTTLLQILKMEEGKVEIPQMTILDYPDIKDRGHFFETRYGSNLMELDDWKHVIDHMESMKQNHLTLSVYGCWCVQYDGRISEYLYVPIKAYPKLQTPVVGKYYSPKKKGWVNFEKLPPMVTKDFFGDVIAYGKTKGVNVLPMFNSLGHNTLIPRLYPEVSAKKENGEPANSVFCTSNPETYKMLFTIYDEIIDRYLIPNGVKSFDIGLDEIGNWCSCPQCKDKTKGEIFIEHAVKLAAHLKSRGMTTVYMYCDMLCRKWGVDNEDACADLVAAFKENDLLDTVCFDWWAYPENRKDMMFQSTRPELGIRRSQKPWNGYYHWNVVTHPLRNNFSHGEIAHEEKIEAIRSYSAWDESYDRTHRVQADIAWNWEGTKGLEESKDRYVKLNFQNRYYDAKRAMDLMDLATKTLPEKEGLPSRSNMLQSGMAYYFYSYQRAGKPYPRHFPGEVVEQFAANAGYVSEAREIANHARAAADIFADLVKDTTINTFMAGRYLYENRNYQTIAEDFLTLVEMDSLAKSECPCRFDKIRALAKERKENRLTLMALLENTKEEFLMASHMRNQTIFMQYFADLEAYLTNTPKDEITLDFTDNTHFASPAFMNLR